MRHGLKRTGLGIIALIATTTALIHPAWAQMPPPPAGGISNSNGFGNTSNNATTSNSQPLQYGTPMQNNTSIGARNTTPYYATPPSASNGAVQQSQNQAGGNYGSISRDMGNATPLGMIQNAWDKPRANMTQGQIAPGVVRFQWSPPLVMQLHLRDFMVTTVIFPKWEQITEIFVGEKQGVRSKLVKQNIIMFQNTESGIDTTATALAKSGNVYQFYLRAEGTNTKRLTDVTAFVDVPNQQSLGGSDIDGGVVNAGNFNGGNNNSGSLGQPVSGPSIDGAPGTDSQQPSVNNPDMIVPRDKMVFNMRLYDRKGHPEDMEIAPEFVYTDGVWTYFNFGSKARSMDRPIVRRVVDGVETTVNSRTEGPNGEILVAEGLGDFTLRNGSKVICAKRVTR